jgi:ribonuclease P protein component
MPTPSQVSGRRWECLLRRADFLRVAASGLRRVTPGFILQAAAREAVEPGPVRIGFTASRKVGNAVARSRAKRRLRALSDRIMADTADVARDYVLVARTETVTREFAAMERELHQALAKLPKTSATQAPKAAQ